MTGDIKVSDKAFAEIKKAVDWYNEELWGLGDEFLVKLEYHFNLILK